jgi:gamma-glutamylcyclotransferase (GGCT)/AIG2-like uncharacterized protein YtfP
MTGTYHLLTGKSLHNMGMRSSQFFQFASFSDFRDRVVFYLEGQTAPLDTGGGILRPKKAPPAHRVRTFSLAGASSKGGVYGERLPFDNPETRLPAIDRLEGFHPGGPCLYRRVLVPVRANRTELAAWLYVVGDRWTGGCKELTGGIWH